MTAHAIADAVVPQYSLIVTATDQVQLLYGLKFCHATAANPGRRVFALGGERILRAGGIERHPYFLRLDCNIGEQWRNFAEADVPAPELQDQLDGFAADAQLQYSDPLVPNPAGDAAPTVTVRRTFRIHPKLGCLFIQPMTVREAVLLVARIREAVPAALRARIEPLVDFVRAAATAATAGGTTSAIRSRWVLSGVIDEEPVEAFYYDLLQYFAPRAAPLPPPPSPPTPGGRGPGPSGPSDPVLIEHLKTLADNSSAQRQDKAREYKPDELAALLRICNIPAHADGTDCDVTDLSAFLQDWPKYRKDTSQARAFMERTFTNTTKTVGFKNHMVFSNAVVKDFAGLDFRGSDLTTAWGNRHRGFSYFGLAPLDTAITDGGENLRQQFLTYEDSTLKVQDRERLNQISTKVTALTTTPKDAYGSMRWVMHIKDVILVFLGPHTPLTVACDKFVRLLQSPMNFRNFSGDTWSVFHWRIHCGFRQYFVEEVTSILDRLVVNVEANEPPSVLLLPVDVRRGLIRDEAPAMIGTDSSSSSGSDISSLSGGSTDSSEAKKAKKDSPSLAHMFKNKIAAATKWLKDKGKGAFSIYKIFPGGALDVMLGPDFRECVEKKTPCVQHFVIGHCGRTGCTRQHRYTKQPTTAITGGMVHRFNEGVDKYLADQGKV
jgi:hypothetical protein